MGALAFQASGSAFAARRGGQGERIGISTWSFHNLFTATKEESAPVPKTALTALEFPAMMADRYQVHSLEIVAPHFESTTLAYLAELKRSLEASHSRLVNIPVDIKELRQGGGLSDPEEGIRDQAIAGCMRWIDAAHELGAKSVRCDPGAMKAKDLSATVASYRKLAAYGVSRGVRVLIENHGGVGSEHPEELVRLFRAVGPNLGALPDFGNFPDEATRQRGLPELFPFASTVAHAKGLKFDAQGNETQFDFARCMAAAKEAGFKGVFSVEYEGGGDPYVGVGNVVNELKRSL